jgi:SAM-dependent methyltransferase
METERANTLTLILLEEAGAYNRWIVEQISPFLKGSILEVGCGIGNLTGFLLNQGRVLATDLRKSYLDFVKKKYDGHPNLIGTMAWDVRIAPPEELCHAYDTIVCSNVLEHIEDDLSVLSHFHQVLVKDGRLILLVPALNWLYNQIDKNLGHCRRYSRKALIVKLEQSGFRIFYLTYFNLFGILGWYLNGSILRRKLLPKNQLRLFSTMVPLFRFVEKIVPAWIGQSLIAVGVKR